MALTIKPRLRKSCNALRVPLFPIVYNRTVVRPGCSGAELTMDTVNCLALSLQRFKGLPEDLLGCHPLQNRLSTDVEVRRGRRVSGDAARIGKMCFIVTATTCYSECHRQTSTTSSSASDPLL